MKLQLFFIAVTVYCSFHGLKMLQRERLCIVLHSPWFTDLPKFLQCSYELALAEMQS